MLSIYPLLLLTLAGAPPQPAPTVVAWPVAAPPRLDWRDTPVSKDPIDRQRLACVLDAGPLPTQWSVHPLLEVFAGDAGPEARFAALRSLARMGAVYALQRTAQADIADELRGFAGFAAGLLEGDPKPVVPCYEERPLVFFAWGLDF